MPGKPNLAPLLSPPRPGMVLPAEQRHYATRVARIGERDFWSAMRLPAEIRKAVGREGHAALAAWHGRELLAENEHGVAEARRRLAESGALRKARADAARVLRGEIVGWMAHRISFGRTIDFNADFGRSGQYGFHYLGWLRPVVDLYLTTGRAKYRERLLEIVGQYYAQRLGIRRRIPGLCPVYYELGSWAKTGVLLPAYLALAARGELYAADAERFLKLFLGFARALLRCQRAGFRHGNWQIVGAAALFRLARTFPEFREAERWRRKAIEILLAHVRRDFFADGGHHERCVGYGWMSLKGVADAWACGLRLGGLSAREARELGGCVRRGLRWFARLATPTGVGPAFGDGDLISLAPVFDAARGFLPPDRPGSGRLLGVRRDRSEMLAPSGYAVMRDGAGRGARYLNVNFGPSGGGHTHDNLLDVNLWAFGRPLIEEVGRFDSYDNPLDKFFRSARAHNQVEIEDLAMDRAAAAGRGVRWRSRRGWDFFSAHHDGFPPKGSQPGVRVRRSIVFLKGAGFLIHDSVESPERIFVAAQHWHSPRSFRPLGPGRARTAGSPGCLVLWTEPGDVRRVETGTDVAPGEVTAARLYGPRHRLTLRKWRDVQDRRPLAFVTFLYPFRGRMPAVSLRRVGDERAEREGGEFEVCVPEGSWRVRLRPGRSPDRPWSCAARRLR